MFQRPVLGEEEFRAVFPGVELVQELVLDPVRLQDSADGSGNLRSYLARFARRFSRISTRLTASTGRSISDVGIVLFGVGLFSGLVIRPELSFWISVLGLCAVGISEGLDISC